MSTVETEESRKVSNKQLLKDIANTEREQLAYQKLTAGYSILASQPENAGPRARQHTWRANQCVVMEEECSKFLKELYALKEERGL